MYSEEQIEKLLEELDQIADEALIHPSTKLHQAVRNFLAQPPATPETNSLEVITPEDLREKITFLADNFVRGRLQREIREVLNSGVLELSNFDNDFHLPHYVFAAIIKNYAKSLMPFSNKGKEVVRNIQKSL